MRWPHAPLEYPVELRACAAGRLAAAETSVCGERLRYLAVGTIVGAFDGIGGQSSKLYERHTNRADLTWLVPGGGKRQATDGNEVTVCGDLVEVWRA